MQMWLGGRIVARKDKGSELGHVSIRGCGEAIELFL